MKELMSRDMLHNLMRVEKEHYREEVMRIVDELENCRAIVDSNEHIRALLGLGDSLWRYKEQGGEWYCWMDALQDNLQEYVLDQYQNNSEPVPKILHFIWIGSEIPKVALDYVKVWAVINPDYKINIWYDSNLLRLKALSDKIKGAALNADSSKGSGYRDYIFMTRQIFLDFANRNYSVVFRQPSREADALIGKFAEDRRLGEIPEQRVWNEEPLPDNIRIRDLFEEGILANGIYPVYMKEAVQTQNFAALSDMARLLVLARFGGIYLDVDMLPQLEDFLYEQFRDIDFCERTLLQAIMHETGAVEGYSTEFLEDSPSRQMICQALEGKQLSELMKPLGNIMCHRAICRLYHKTRLINQMVVSHPESVMVDLMLTQIIRNYALMDRVFGAEPIFREGFEQVLGERIARQEAVENRRECDFLSKCTMYHGAGFARGCNCTIYLTGPGVYSGAIWDMEELNGHMCTRVPGISDYKKYECFLLPPEILSVQTEAEKDCSWMIRG